ncbi:hypothetical protein JMA_39530 (plasmid) [Jeotgalibacillus malaysiensis]|uniref:Uncharacterized protein n=1 Tax=Jeotgalibacillus malaysiensis TaxID=1508404 RepID=A0A0B5AT17_9BACL|nr:hypothetical protein [Jeotgalibacillus malaysiensis]AJD93271.1 hypothetical protein JMA_39530 [Jeotgalibacillus malaysiensis]
MKKYELTGTFTTHSNGEDEFTLYQIEALVDIPRYNVKKGDRGGFIECEDNLSHQGDCWIGRDSYVFDESRVNGNAFVEDSTIFGGTRLTDNVIVRKTRFIGIGSNVFDNCAIHDTVVHGKLIARYDTTIEKTVIFGELVAFQESIVISDSKFHGAVRLSKNTHIEKSIIRKIHFGDGKQRIRFSTLESNEPGQVQGELAVYDSHVSANEVLIETASRVHFHNVHAMDLKKMDVKGEVDFRQVFIHPGTELSVNNVYNEGVVTLIGTFRRNVPKNESYGINVSSKRIRMVDTQFKGDVRVIGDWDIDDTKVEGAVLLESKNERSTILDDSSVKDFASIHIPFSSKNTIHINTMHLQGDEVYTAIF